MKRKFLLPILVVFVLGGGVILGAKYIKGFNTLSASILDNPTNSAGKPASPFTMATKGWTPSEGISENSEGKINLELREILAQNKLQEVFPKATFPKGFSAEALHKESNLHKNKESEPRFTVNHNSQIKIDDDLSNLVSHASFILTRLYHRDNLSFAKPKEAYYLNEHFPQERPENEAYQVDRFGNFLVVKNDKGQVEYLHTLAYHRVVERGTYEYYENYVVKFNPDGSLDHFISFQKGQISWTKLNYDDKGMVSLVEDVSLSSYKNGSNTMNHNYYYRTFKPTV